MQEGFSFVKDKYKIDNDFVNEKYYQYNYFFYYLKNL